MPRVAKPTTPNASTATIGFEAKLWLTADKLRNNMDAAEYKHVVLGLIFLKYISDTFEEHRAKLLAGQGDYAGANAEDPDEPSGARQPAAGSPEGRRGGAWQRKAVLPELLDVQRACAF
jgi:type I restriction-modification system DNA methylase subunit